MSERDFMLRAVAQAQLTTNKDDSGRYPKVGAVVVKDNREISVGYRGERGLGTHAEFVALEGKLKGQSIAGATVYTTLEPCTKRGADKTPCAQRLFERQVAKVVIGILDPNKDIRGKGEWYLQEHGIHVGRFDPDLVKEIRELNRTFINYQSEPGIIIDGPSNNATVPEGIIVLTGTCRNQPLKQDRLCVFARCGSEYRPQSPITFLPKGKWQCNVWIGEGERQVLVTRVSEDVQVMVGYYSKVHTKTKEWVAIDIAAIPDGIEILAEISVTGAKRPRSR